MKEGFGKGFGFIVGAYVAILGIKCLDILLTNDNHQSKETVSENVKQDEEF